MKKVETVDALKQVYQKESYVLLKHSITCPISAEAYSETEAFSKDSDIPVYYLNVQELREGANDAADHFGIKHESPQAFLVHNQQLIWNDSHWRVTKKNLQEQVSQLS
ncbi:bacillithiol system redox-active protein YtxJ [Alkalicoccus daliensis]|uniref:Bacillithiol system protein YtxJ n=1 Tax=Alkalicoccus daliensis TaxID=745820 RepID=A0A1H0C8S8_9BACI|nr:bacillithiol system redox-active protein YtxJ [Alkalicoccus daliensis]SDN54251.1 bacillithiol system protein YtxJ [Alkalicoccus daliensis]